MINYLEILNQDELNIYNKKYKELLHANNFDNHVLLICDSFDVKNENIYYYCNMIYFLPIKLRISHNITKKTTIPLLKKINFSMLRFIEIPSGNKAILLQKKFPNKLFYLGFKITKESIYNYLDVNYYTTFCYLPNSIKIITNDKYRKYSVTSLPNKLRVFKVEHIYKNANITKLPINCIFIVKNNIIKKSYDKKRKLYILNSDISNVD